MLDTLPTEGPVGDQPDTMLGAVFGDAVSQILIIQRRQAHLDRGDPNERPGGADLTHRDVAQADVADLAFFLKAGEGADARLERRSRIAGVERGANDFDRALLIPIGDGG